MGSGGGGGLWRYFSKLCFFQFLSRVACECGEGFFYGGNYVSAGNMATWQYQGWQLAPPTWVWPYLGLAHPMQHRS